MSNLVYMILHALGMIFNPLLQKNLPGFISLLLAAIRYVKSQPKRMRKKGHFGLHDFTGIVCAQQV